jgi:hypothetical protein
MSFGFESLKSFSYFKRMYEKMYSRISSFSFESLKRLSATLLAEISVNEGIWSRGVAVQDHYVE